MVTKPAATAPVLPMPSVAPVGAWRNVISRVCAVPEGAVIGMIHTSAPGPLLVVPRPEGLRDAEGPHDLAPVPQTALHVWLLSATSATNRTR